MQRYLDQTPQEDAGTYARLVRAVKDPLEEKSLAEEKKPQLDRPLIEADSFLISFQFSTGCSFIGSSNICWAYHVYFGYLRLELHIHVAYGNSVLLTDNLHHVKSSETLYTCQKWQNPRNIPCLDSGCSMESFEADALELWLHHINTHLEQFTTLCDAQIISKATQGNAKFVYSPNNSDSIIMYGHEIIRRLNFHVPLRELLQHSTLVEDPKNINQRESRQTFSFTSATIISYNLQTAQGNLVASLRMNNGQSNHNYLKKQLLSRHFARDTANSLKNHLQMEQQEQEDSTISDYSSSPSSQPLGEIFSLKNPSNTDTNSTSIFVRGDDEEADLINTMTEQIPCSDLVDEFARFTLSWLMAWTASRRNNMGSNLHDQEVHADEGQNRG